jgi:hypothetical protein
MLGVGAGVFMSTLDASIVNISLPTLVDSFETNLATIEWVVLSYMLVLTSFMLGVARLGDMYDKKKLYMGGLALFTVSSLLCGIAPGVGWLIAFRALQGAGAAMTQALGIAIITEVFPASERGRALGLMGTTVSTGIAVGPPLGGLLIGLVGWRFIFLINIPVGILALWLVKRFVPSSRGKPGQRFDIPGAALLFLTLAAYALGMTLGQQNGFTDAGVRALLASAVVGLALFLWAERRALPDDRLAHVPQRIVHPQPGDGISRVYRHGGPVYHALLPAARQRLHHPTGGAAADGEPDHHGHDCPGRRRALGSLRLSRDQPGRAGFDRGWLPGARHIAPRRNHAGVHPADAAVCHWTRDVPIAQ